MIIELDLLPVFVRRFIERSSSSSISPSEADQTLYQQGFLRKERISSPEELNFWLTTQDISEPQLSRQLFYSLQLEQFKHSKYSSQVENQFLENKSNLDKVMYSMIRTKQRAKCYELYLRITEEEDSFADLASEFSEGVEQQVNGLIGPLELGTINVAIAERLRVSKQGQLWEPFQQDGWWVLLRLEKLLPAKLDDSMKRRIIDDLHNNWIRQKTKEELSSILKHISDLRSDQAVTPASPEETIKSSLLEKVWSKFSGSPS